MRQLLLILFLLLPSISTTSSVVEWDLTCQTEAGRVYICTGPDAERYHSKADCRGLKNCSKSIVEMSLSEAQKKGFTPCKICHKQRRAQ